MKDNITFAILVWTFVLFAAWALALVGYLMRIEASCLERGWAGADITWNFRGYCTARINQTDVVVPWRSAERR